MKKIIKIVFIIFGILILIELYLRIFNYETLKTRVRDLAYIPDSLYGFRYKSNSDQVFIWPGISKKFRFNNHGFYGPDFSEIKNKNTYRIIFVGNSVTFGVRTDGEKNFVMKLQDLFKKANYNIEVINCSVDGANRDIGNMNIVKYETAKFNPDLVLFEFHFPLSKQQVIRDEYKDYMLKYDYSLKDSVEVMKAKIDKIYAAKFLCKIYDVSFIVRAFCRWLDNHKEKPFGLFFDKKILKIEYISSYIKKEKNKVAKKDKKIKDNFSKEESLKMYKDMEHYLDSLNIKFETYSLFGKFDKQNIPINPTYVGSIKWDEALIIKEEGHVNNEGHDLIAKDLFNQLTHSLLPLNNYKNKQ
jgi:hypothetical protein